VNIRNALLVLYECFVSDMAEQLMTTLAVYCDNSAAEALRRILLPFRAGLSNSLR